jgi:uracil-DNA glycosylase family 4
VERAPEDLSPAEAASALQWWIDAGCDVIAGEEPRDWLKAAAAAAPIETKSFAPTASAPADEPLPGQLDLFQAWLRDSDRLPYAASSAPRICPAGDPASGLMVMTDMPTSEDCAAGTLLAGSEGRLFDRMLAAMGRDRESIYLAALSCLRSDDGRLTGAPGQQCALLARHHIGLAAPRALILFGDAVSKALVGLPVARGRGRWHEVATHAGPVPAIVTLSPAYLLNHPAQKALAWADLQMVMERLK